jgi:hypothetical protein
MIWVLALAFMAIQGEVGWSGKKCGQGMEKPESHFDQIFVYLPIYSQTNNKCYLSKHSSDKYTLIVKFMEIFAYFTIQYGFSSPTGCVAHPTTQVSAVAADVSIKSQPCCVPLRFALVFVPGEAQ